MRYFLILLLFINLSFADSPSSFNQAKKIAARIFAAHALTLYCQCPYDKKGVDLDRCEMASAHTVVRAHRIEWEHIAAVEHWGKNFDCWRIPLCERHGKPYKGRACCEKMDTRFKHMESELYNIWPAVGLVNQVRSNYRFAELSQKTPFYGCPLRVDASSRRVEPADNVKGIVARAYLFMSDFYQWPLSKSQHQLFLAWNKQFPPNAWEKEWAHQIAEIEGYQNPYIIKERTN